jgi:predicted ArsR family transcriptional regulator
MDTEKKVQVPRILFTGKRGVNIKIWTFLYINDHRWFTAKEISEYLELPLSTVQLSLKRINKIAPRIHSEDIQTEGPGRPEKRYRLQRNFIP